MILRLLTMTAFLLSAALLSGCGGTDRSHEPAAQKPFSLKSFVLYDVQTRGGGDAVWAKKDGSIVIQVVTPEGIANLEKLREKRYQINSRPGIFSEVELTVGSRNLMDLKLKKGLGDNRTIIMLVPHEGATVKLTREGNASDLGFDQLYLYLQGRCREIEVQEKPSYEGPYNKDWRPAGFDRPW